MKKTRLFEPYTIKEVVFKNRIAMAPMCQYSAKNDGLLQDWHRTHYTSRAVGQVGLIITEATAVESRGRISEKDLGLWDDAAIAPFSELIQQIKSYRCKIGIQIAHAGRKAAIRDEAIVAPSAIPFDDQLSVPLELTKSEIGVVVAAFGNAVRRAVAAGVDFIEIHAAHGYLINQFLSPLSNKRQDVYGADRSLFLKEVLEEVHTHIPEQMPVFVRVSAEDYVEGGNHPEEICRLLYPVKHLIDLVHVSSGGVVENAVINMVPGYQVSFAETIKRQLNLPVMAVGMLESPELAEETLKNGSADLIALGRELLRNPYWPLQAAKALGEDIAWPEAYQRAKI
jgi:NADPH2 dehydrogenase